MVVFLTKMLSKIKKQDIPKQLYTFMKNYLYKVIKNKLMQFDFNKRIINQH